MIDEKYLIKLIFVFLKLKFNFFFNKGLSKKELINKIIFKFGRRI